MFWKVLVKVSIECKIKHNQIVLSFPYDREVVQALKRLKYRKFDKKKKVFYIDILDLDLLISLLSKIRYVDCSKLIAARDSLQTNVDDSWDANPSEELLTPLMKHQVEGVKFLSAPISEAINNTLNGSRINGRILGDYMGLGKTAQAAIAAKTVLEAMNPEGRILVVSPANYKIGWDREIKRFCGEESTYIWRADDKKPPNLSARWHIINYDILHKKHNDLLRMGFDILILDEVHYIRNPSAARSKSVLGYKPPKKKRITGLSEHAKYVIALTGTPVVNRITDLFSILKAIHHPLGDTYSRFLGRYCEVNRVDRGGVFSFEVIGLKNIDELKEIISPVFLQRKNVAGLKPIVRTLIPVEVNTSQYRTVMLDYYKKKNSHLIKTLTDKISYYNKAKQILAIEKVPFTISRIEESVEAGGKILMFSFYRDVVSTIKDHFDKSAVMLMGGMAEKDIQSSIDSFQNDPSKKVFVGQINAAGSAITLTAANRVIFNDLDWVPANLLQAEGRANRKGQTSTVFSEYIIAANTFDEKLAEVVETKLLQINEFEGTNVSIFEEFLKEIDDQ